MINLTLVKSHLRIDCDDDGENAYLQLLTDAAVKAVSGKMNRILVAESADSETSPANALVINPDVIAACLLLIGHLYENRESVTMGTMVELPMSVQYLIAPYVFYHLN